MDTSSVITSKTGAKKIGKPTAGIAKQPKDATINDRDRVAGLLMHEKQIVQGYTTGLVEVFDPELYGLVKKARGRVEDLHAQVLEVLFNSGEYTADVAPPEQVTDTYDVFTGYLNQLPYQGQTPH